MVVAFLDLFSTMWLFQIDINWNTVLRLHYVFYSLFWYYYLDFGLYNCFYMLDMFDESKFYVFMIIMFWFDKEFMVVLYKLHFLISGLGPIYKRNFTKFLVDFRCIPYEFLGSVSRNRDPLKDTWRLPRVRPLGRDVTAHISSYKYSISRN